MPTLPDWLDTLRQRNITATADHGTVHLHGPATNLDHAWLHRHHDALTIAAAGTHPTWWTIATSPTATGSIHPDNLPDLGCAAKQCNGDLHHYSPDAIPHCTNHHPDVWNQPLPKADTRTVA